MFPTLLTLGAFSLPTYTFLIDLGLLAGLGWVWRQAPPDKRQRWFDATLVAILGGLAGARLLYAFVNGGYYFGHFFEIFEIWKGGLAWLGAVAGGLLGAWLYCRRQREPLAPFLDGLALPMALLALLSWGGCLAASCAYGYEVTPGQLPQWLTLETPDIYGLTALRFPTQILGLAWSLLGLWLVWWTQANPHPPPSGKPPMGEGALAPSPAGNLPLGRAGVGRGWQPGAYAAYTLSLIALGAFALAFTRGDPMPLALGFYRLDVVGSAIVLVGASLAWGLRTSKTKSQTPNLQSPITNNQLPQPDSSESPPPHD